MTHVDTRTPRPFDAARAEAFAGRMVESLNAAAAMLMTSIGHRTGLFDAMAALPGPADSAAIAAAAGLNERYVREWLSAMAVAGFVDYDAAAATFRLPPEHAACLTRAATPDNLAVFAQFFPVVGSAEQRLIACFRTGEGTRYDDYPCFHQVMAEDSGQTVVASLFDHVLPLAPGLEARLAEGIDVLDAGCGSGRALVALAERFPRSRFTGYDLCADAVARAREAAAAAGVDNLRIDQRDLTGWSEPGAYDFITSFDAVHDQKDPQGLIAGIRRSLKPGGVYLMQDIGGSAHLADNLDHPLGTLLYTVSCLHCMPVSLGQGGAGLGTMWGWQTAERMLREAGFAAIERHTLAHDPMNVWFVSTAP